MTPQSRPLIEFLRAFPGEDQGDLRRLDEVIIEACGLPRSNELDDALLGIFERFPHEDGRGVYWGIIHGLEARGGYEKRLLASLRRSPSQFGLTMINRMCNGGISTCAGVSNLALLEEVASAEHVHPDTRAEAQGYLDHQRGQTA